MDLKPYLVQSVGLLIVFCVALPFLGGTFLYHALRLGRNPDETADAKFKMSRFWRVFFIATIDAYLFVMFLGVLIPGLGAPVAVGVVLLTEVALIAFQLRPVTSRLLLVAVATVLLTNALTYGIAWILVPGAATIQAHR